MAEITTNLTSVTPRELEVSEQVYLGRSNESGAKQLGITRATFSTHLQHVFKKWGVDNRASVARIFGELRSAAELGKSGRKG